MARLFFAALVGVSALFQATLLPELNPLQVQPNLVLVLLLVWTAQHGVGEGILWAAGIGFLLDLLAMDTLGTNGIALLAVVLIGGLARRRFFHHGLMLPMVLTLFAAFIAPFLVLLLRDVVGSAQADIAPAIRLIVPQALLAMMIVPPLYLLAVLLDRRFSGGRL